MFDNAAPHLDLTQNRLLTHMPNPIRTFAFAITFALLSPMTMAQAADESANPDFIGLISQMWVQKCPELVTGLVMRGDVQPALQSRPIDVAAVCSCSNAGLLADDKLRAQFVGDPEMVKMRMQEGLLKPYFTLRMIQSAFVCLGDDIDKSLNAVSFTQ